MHVLESYALQNGLKIDTPSIYEKFFPLAVERFITIDTSTLGTGALEYSHWHLVINLIAPKLAEEGISIIQLGDKENVPLQNCYIALGQCNFNQKAYVIKKSLVHICPNNESMHIASSFGKKCVALFSNNSFPSQFHPYWSEEEDVKIVSPPITKKPSFNPNESPRSIKCIKPEDVAEKILSFLNLPASHIEFQTLKIGDAFNNKRIESTLSHLLDCEKLGISSLIVRMDLNFNEKALESQLQHSPCSIITNKPLSNAIIENYANRIVELVFYIQDDNEEGVKFIQKVKEKSINFLLRSRNTGWSLDDCKLAYFDYGLVHPVKRRSQDDYPELKGEKNLYYKSNHFIIHNNNFYPSSLAVVQNIHSSPSMDHEPYPVVDDPLFWEDVAHFHFLKKKS